MSLTLAVYRWPEPNAGDIAVFRGLQSLFPSDTSWVSINLWESFDRAIEAANGCDGLIIGGGTIVGNLNTWVVHPDFARRIRVPVAVLGTGIRDEGRASIDPELRDGVRTLLDVADPVGLRGALSLQLLRDSGIDPGNALVCGDMALALQAPDLGVGRGVAINVRPRPGGGESVSIAMLGSMLKDDAFDEFGPVTLFSCHDKWDLGPADDLGHPIRRYDDSFSSFMDMLASNQLVVSERLHGTVLAHSIGRPAVQLSYENKCLDYMASVNCADLCLIDRDPDRLISMCRSALASQAHFAPMVETFRRRLSDSAAAFQERLGS